MKKSEQEAGSTLPLTIFFGFLGLVLIFVVVAATSLYLERARLFTLADGAALAGAEGFSLADVGQTDDGLRADLSGEDVAQAVGEYLDTAPTGGFEALELRRADALDGRSATVTLSALWRPPLPFFLVPGGVRLEATAVARSVFR